MVFHNDDEFPLFEVRNRKLNRKSTSYIRKIFSLCVALGALTIGQIIFKFYEDYDHAIQNHTLKTLIEHYINRPIFWGHISLIVVPIFYVWAWKNVREDWKFDYIQEWQNIKDSETEAILNSNESMLSNDVQQQTNGVGV